jgi:hypothetical protein
MWLNVVTTPDPAHAGLADPLCRRHGAATPMRAPFGLGLQGGVNHGLDSSHIVTGFPPPAGSNLPKRLGSATAETLAPEADCLTVQAVVRAIIISDLPAATARIMRQRSATCCGVPKATTQPCSSLRWSGDRTRGSMARGMIYFASRLDVCPAICGTLH